MATTKTFSASMFCHGSDNAWNTSSTARQGIYAASDSNIKTPRTGIIYFSGMGDALKDKYITSITLSWTLGGSGGSWQKIIQFYGSNYQTKPTKSGTPYPGSYITNQDKIVAYTMSSTGSGMKFSMSMNVETNSSEFHKLARYLETGANILCLHSDDTANRSGYSFSTNYLEINACSIQVTYEERVSVHLWFDCPVDEVTTNITFLTADREEESLVNYGGDGPQGFHARVPLGGEIYITTPQRQGYLCTGWYIDYDPDGDAHCIVESGLTTIFDYCDDTVINATWVVEKCRVSFDNGSLPVDSGWPQDIWWYYGSDLTLPRFDDIRMEWSYYDSCVYLHNDNSTNALDERVSCRYKYHPVAWQYINNTTGAEGSAFAPGQCLPWSSIEGSYDSRGLTFKLRGTPIHQRQSVSLPSQTRAGYKFKGWKDEYPHAFKQSIITGITSENNVELFDGELGRSDVFLLGHRDIPVLGKVWIDDGEVLENYFDGEFVYWGRYKMNNMGKIVPVISLFNVEQDYDMKDTFPNKMEATDCFYYSGNTTIGGQVCNLWRKHVINDPNDPNDIGTTFIDDVGVPYCIITENLVEAVEKVYSSGYKFTPWAEVEEEVHLYAVWELQGQVHIDTVTSWKPHTVWIDSGTEWKQYMMYVDTGTEWKMLGG